MSNYLTSEESLLRQKRARLFYTASAMVSVLAGAALLWALRPLIMPLMIGVIMAYIFLPLIGYLKGKGFSRFWAVIFLSGIFSLLLFSTINMAGRIIPDQKEELELQVRIRYKINEKFDQMMGLEKPESGNFFYTLFGKELEPLRTSLDSVLRLSDAERELFTIFYSSPDLYGFSPVAERYWQYYQANRQRDQKAAKLQAEKQELAKNRDIRPPTDSAPTNNANQGSMLLLVFNAVSLWLITPMVFLTLLFDDGKLKRNVVQAVPNRYFELTLTVFDNINEALGQYLRGTAIECFLVGSTFTLGLFLVGVEMQWAITIGAIAGLANAIPFLGPLIGLLVGLMYAILTERISPILPFINERNLVLSIIMIVAVVQLADNAVFQPYILGSAVNLHPLVVIIGVMGGAVTLGFAGMLFAIPTIMVIKVIVTTVFRQFRAYYII